jgi:hypothetical protein
MGTVSRAGFIVIAVAAASLEVIALASWQGWLPNRVAARQVAAPIQLSQRVVVAPLAARPLPVAQPAPVVVQLNGQDRYYQELRARIRWVQTRLGSNMLDTPDLSSRMLLAKSAAQRAGLHEVGLSFEDVYGIINAETSWVPRLGASKDGTPNLGIAQFEPATARALGLRDPNDLVEAVHVAAVHMREAAIWSEGRIARLKKLDQQERALKLREGVSIYYNLSSRGRSVWNGENTKRLPTETRAHIRNARIGAEQAAFLDIQLQPVARRSDVQPMLTAGLVQNNR